MDLPWKDWIESLPPALLCEQRWFAAKGRTPAALRLVDLLRLGEGAALSVVEVRFSDGFTQQYQMPWVFDRGCPPAGAPGGVLEVRAVGAGERGRLREPAADEGFWAELLDAFRGGLEREGRCGRFVFRPTALAAALPATCATPCRGLEVEQSNTSVVYGERLLLKLYRRLESGAHPEIEVCGYLGGEVDFDAVASFGGSLEYVGDDGRSVFLALLAEYLPGSIDCWTLFLDALRAEGTTDPCSQLGVALGELTASLHVALSEATPEPLRAEPLAAADLRALAASCRDELAAARSLLSAAAPQVAPAIREGLAEVAGDVERCIDRLATAVASGQRFRIHGDYHLGQVLRARDRLYIVDFEGEPARPLAARRLKQSPLKDVAGMLRSFDYAVACAGAEPGRAAGDLRRLGREARRSFLEHYEERMDFALLPEHESRRRLLRYYELEKALYELNYEINNRPRWASIPLDALRALVREAD